MFNLKSSFGDSVVTLLRQISHPIQFTHLEFTIQRCLLYSQCSTITTILKHFGHTERKPQILLQSPHYFHSSPTSAAAAAKLLQSCPTLCDPRDSSPPGSPMPGILQARILECDAICQITTNLLSVSISLPILDISQKWDF